MYLLTKDPVQCCGCGACKESCSHQAISMQADEHGFSYPVINKELCVQCGLCEKVCPVENKPQPNDFQPRYFAVRSKEAELVAQSSSGGMFTMMAEQIFQRGGVVYGVAYGEGFRVEHRRAADMEQAAAFRTSKYVQSDPTQLYRSVKLDLERGLPVLATGTPCQIAGLRKWLTQLRVDTAQLYTVDNICHGVSSPLTFADYMKALEQYVPEGDRISYVNMRHKKNGGEQTALEICTEKNGRIAEVDQFSYYRFFRNCIGNRPSCFACPFACWERMGDLSTGDFWNSTSGNFSFDTSGGVNEVLINSGKGLELFEALAPNACYQEISKEKAWQPHLEYATKKPENYDAFWSEYLSGTDRESVLRKYVKPGLLSRIIYSVSPILRKTGLYALFGKLYRLVFVRK